jgi:hypothetical protein
MRKLVLLAAAIGMIALVANYRSLPFPARYCAKHPANHACIENAPARSPMTVAEWPS